MRYIEEETPLSVNDEWQQTAQLLALSQRYNSLFFILGLALGVLLAHLVAWLFPEITKFTLWATPFVLSPALAICGYRWHWHRQLLRRLHPTFDSRRDHECNDE